MTTTDDVRPGDAAARALADEVSDLRERVREYEAEQRVLLHIVAAARVYLRRIHQVRDAGSAGHRIRIGQAEDKLVDALAAHDARLARGEDAG